MIKSIVMLSYICRVLNVPLKSACEPANDTAAVEDTAKETAVVDEEPLLGAWMQATFFLEKNSLKCAAVDGCSHVAFLTDMILLILFNVLNC